MSSKLFTVKIWLPIGVVITGAFIGYLILTSNNLQPQTKALKKELKKEFKKEKQQKRARTVQVVALERRSVEPTWRASGYVIPSETVNIRARVSGDIEEINAIAQPGQALKKGEWLVKLDPTDFELSLNSQQAQLAQANASLALEQADQVLAKEELALLNQTSELAIDETLVLRKPQLAMAQSKVDVANNNVEKALINLSRTRVVMPFDGKIVDQYIGRGSNVSTNTTLFSVTNTKRYWLEVKIPHLFLPLLNQTQPYKVIQDRLWGKEKYRYAKFISVLPELDTKDRQIIILLAIDKPLDDKKGQPHVFINDFVNVELKGNKIVNAWTIKYNWLQPDNTIWVVDAQQTLQKRAVEVIFKGREFIYIHGKFQEGDLALAEKPGIANIGLPVKVKRLDIPQITVNKSEVINNPENKEVIE